VGALAGDSTVPLDNELFEGKAGTPRGSDGVVGPYGLGVRVPLLVVSPWSTGGWVCSETFDHTSLIRFLEARFGVDEPNITPWRRAVCGDLTSAFDFRSTNDNVPPLPSVAGFEPSGTVPPDFHPTPPAVGSVPTQEAGMRPSRRLGYRFRVGFHADRSRLRVDFRNHGELGVGIQARSLTVAGAPYSYTVGAGDNLTAELPNPGSYDLSLHGPNGFFRHFAGSPATELRVELDGDHGSGRLRLRIIRGEDHRGFGFGRGREPVVVNVVDAFGPDRRIRLHGTEEIAVDTHHSGGWYDLALTTPSDPSFSYQLAGRLESAARLTSDPQLGRS
jgi:phospholipase C